METIFSILKLKTEDGKKPTKIAYVLIIALVGLLILISSNLFSPSNDQDETFIPTEEQQTLPEEETFLQKDKDEEPNEGDIESQYEQELTALLEKIQGVSDVEVMVNLDATKAKVFEKNLVVGRQTTEETDKGGGKRQIEDFSKDQQVVLVRQGDREVPLLVKTEKPHVRGVLIVAKGADHMQVKQWIIEAVSRVLDVPTHRVAVMPKNKEE